MGCSGTWRTWRRITLIASTEYVTILFGMKRRGLGADGHAFWNIHLWWDILILAPLGSLTIGRLLGSSEFERELNREILMEICLVLFSSFSGIYTCLGDLDLDSSGVLFISIDQEIDRSIVGSIGRSGVLSWYLSGDFESNWDFNCETVSNIGLVRLVLSWFHILGTLLISGSLGRSGFWSGDRKFDRSRFLWDIDLLGDLLGAWLGERAW